MRTVGLVLLALVGAAACESADPASADAPLCPDTPYYSTCTKAPDSCPAPYTCTTVTHAGETRDVCLIPCDSPGTCPTYFFCKGVEGGSSVGANHTCVCI